MYDIEQAEVDKMAEQGREDLPPPTDCVALVVFVPNKDSTLQDCVYYRRENAMKIHNAYPIPSIDERIDN